MYKTRLNTTINVLLFADGTVFTEQSKNNLQSHVFKFGKSAEGYDLRILDAKTKRLVFQGKRLIRLKIVLSDTGLEQVSKINYLACCVILGNIT